MRFGSSRLVRRLAGCVMLFFAVATASAQAPATPDAKPAGQPLSAEARARYVGSYEVPGPGGAMPFRVYEEGEHLMAQPGADQPTRLVYQGNEMFRPEAALTATMTFTVEGGKATRFVVVFPDGKKMEGVRKE